MLKDEKNNIELKALSPEDMPVIITKPEFMRRFKDMQQFQNIGGGEMPEFYNIVINSNNPLITDKLLNMKSEEKRKDLPTTCINWQNSIRIC